VAEVTSRASHKKAMAEANLGTVVAGRYRLEQLLGVGGMAEVYRAEDLTSERRVAVKILRADIATNPEAVARIKREGELLIELRNPAIVAVETWGQLDDGTVYLVMELLEGETLGERMRRGVAEPAELGPIVAGTCAGLHAAHTRGIVHRDLKPDNVFLCPTEHGLQVKLLDFGISKFYGRERLTQTGEVLGTPRYMSPEQLGSEKEIDLRVDIYALGVILYEALAGKPPFLAATPTDLIVAILHGKTAPLRSARPDVPPGVESVVMRAISKVRAARFDSAPALAEAYIDAVGGVAAVRGAQRRGMATRAMGGMKQSSAPPPPMPSAPGASSSETRRADEVAGHLRLGTFSGLDGAQRESLPTPAAEPTFRTASMGAAQGAAVPGDPGTPLAARAEPDDAWVGFAKTEAMPATQAPVRRAMPATREQEAVVLEPPQIETPRPSPEPPSIPARLAEPPPRRSVVGKLVLVVCALLAGALSAGAVIAVLQYLDAREPSPTPAPAPQQARRPPHAAPSATQTTTIAPDPAEPAAAQDDEPPAEEPAPARAPRARRDTPRETPPAAEPEVGVDPLREAQRALRGGDPARCIEILDEAIRTGAPAIALRRRADCYEAAGRRSEAMNDYQRFCRLLPDHPAIGEVRPLLESWGRTCP
jgi:hypothetical protein